MSKIHPILLLMLGALFALSVPGRALEIVGEEAFITASNSHSYTIIAKNNSWLPYDNKARSDQQAVWVRFPVTLSFDKGELKPRNPFTLSVRLYGSYDFYWDGELIGSNREQATEAHFFSRVTIPVNSLQAGPHEIMVRIETIGRSPGSALDLWIAPAAVKSDFFGIHSSVVIILFVASACFLLTTYFMITLKSADQKVMHVLAAAISAFSGGLIILENGMLLFGFSYLTIDSIGAGAQLLTVLIVFFVPGYIILRFQPRYKIIWFIAVAAILAVGAKYVLPEDKHWFLLAITLVLCIELAIDIWRKGKERYRLALKTERLQAALLRKNIQPHFLMNSLTALMEWVDIDPDSAIEFIDSLAAEFRLLNEFSTKSTVPATQEFDLCRAHLGIMEKRYLGNYQLITSGFCGQEKIPPAIFHTLIENAFSHNHYERLDASFSLSLSEDKKVVTVTVPVVDAKDSQLRTGSGTRYILSRLEETYGKAAKLEAAAVDDVWLTTISLPVGL